MVPCRPWLVTLFLTSVAPAAFPQHQLEPVPVPRIGEARITMKTGEIVRGDSGEKSAELSNAFSNIDWSGHFGVGAVTNSATGNLVELMDWGKVTTPTGSDIVGEFTFGYGTIVSDKLVGGPGASVTLRIYNGVTGFCADSGAVPTASFDFSGLPADSLGAGIGWIVSVDLSGGFEFSSAGVGEPFGFGFTTADDIAGDGTKDTGPLLCYAGLFSNCLDPDSNGQVNAYDAWDESPLSNNCIGTFFWQCDSSFASWYLELETADASGATSASSTFRNGGSNPGTYIATSPPVLGASYVATDQPSNGGFGVYAFGYQTPLDLPTRFGQLLVNVADPAGDQLAGFNGPYPFFGGTAQIEIKVPIRLDLCGVAIATQTIEFGGVLQLHNAQDLVLGF